MLKYNFTDEELLVLGQDAAQMVRDIINKKEELDTIKKEYAAEIKNMQAKVDLNSEHITNGFKMELVWCVYMDTSTHRQYWTEDQNPDVDEPVKTKMLQPGHQYTAAL